MIARSRCRLAGSRRRDGNRHECAGQETSLAGPAKTSRDVPGHERVRTRAYDRQPHDRLRRAVITELICHFALKFAAIERQFGICFRDRFAVELAELTDMQSDGLLALSETGIEVLPPGRLLIRNICMVFDRYLREQASTRFSRVI